MFRYHSSDEVSTVDDVVSGSVDGWPVAAADADGCCADAI